MGWDQLGEVRERETVAVCFHSKAESKISSRRPNITKQKPTHRYREQTSGYEGGVEGGAR